VEGRRYDVNSAKESPDELAHNLCSPPEPHYEGEGWARARTATVVLGGHAEPAHLADEGASLEELAGHGENPRQ
jgi:hypothetical protein